MGKFNSLPEAICHVKCILLWKQKKTREWGVYNYLLQEPKGCPIFIIILKNTREILSLTAAEKFEEITIINKLSF